MRPDLVKPRGRSSNIFINYRREDSSGHAGRLFDALNAHFAGRLFMDIDTLEPGVDFVDAIEQAVGSCEVLIVVIGREWLTIRNAAGQRRLDDPADFVRLEVESALARKIRVIPVLVQDAPMPRAEDLPPAIARLARRNAIELSDARWAYDVDRLVRTIQEILEEKEAAAPAAPLPPETAAVKSAGSRVWLLSLDALGLVAVVVLASALWMRRTPSGKDDPAPFVQPARPAAERVVDKPSKEPTSVPPVSKPEPETPSVKVSPAKVPSVSKPIRKPPLVTVPVDVKPAESPAVPVRTAEPPPPPAVLTPRATITSPAGGAEVGPSVQVQGTILDFDPDSRRAFLCIRQKNGAIYPRGELFPTAGQFSIQLRSSKEKTFEILVVTSATKEAARVLSDQKSRDDGLSVLPLGASISSGVVAVKRQGKIRSIFNPKE